MSFRTLVGEWASCTVTGAEETYVSVRAAVSLHALGVKNAEIATITRILMTKNEDLLPALRVLHAAADPSAWEVRTDIGCICSLNGLVGDIVCDMPNEDASKKNWQSNAESITAIHNAFPTLADRLEAAERERDVYRASLSEIYYRAIPMNEDSGDSTIAHIASDAVRGKHMNPLAARDARMKAMGAAEALRDVLGKSRELPEGEFWRWVEREAARLRREAESTQG